MDRKDMIRKVDGSSHYMGSKSFSFGNDNDEKMFPPHKKRERNLWNQQTSSNYERSYSITYPVKKKLPNLPPALQGTSMYSNYFGGNSSGSSTLGKPDYFWNKPVEPKKNRVKTSGIFIPPFINDINSIESGQSGNSRDIKLKKCRNYEPHQLTNAIHEIIICGKAVSRASAEHNVPKRTLYYNIDKITGGNYFK